MAFDKRLGEGTLQNPHWMKLLVERYERLHIKIVKGARRFTTGRQLAYLPKRQLTRYLKKRQHNAIQSSDFSERTEKFGNFNTDFKSTQNCEEKQAQQDYSDIFYKNLATIERANADYYHFQQRKSVCSSISQNQNELPVHEMCAETLNENLKKSISIHQVTDVSDVSSELPVSPENLSQVSSCHAASKSDLAFHSDLEDNATVSDNIKEPKIDDNVTVKVYTEMDTTKAEDNGDNDVCSYNARNFISNRQVGTTTVKWSNKIMRVKTRTNRTSLKTKNSFLNNHSEDSNVQKSEQTDHIRRNNINSHMKHNRKLSTMTSLTAKGLCESRERVFARMSSEARRAVDETLKEMAEFHKESSCNNKHENLDFQTAKNVHYNNHNSVFSVKDKLNTTDNLVTQNGQDKDEFRSTDACEVRESVCKRCSHKCSNVDTHDTSFNHNCIASQNQNKTVYLNCSKFRQVEGCDHFHMDRRFAQQLPLITRSHIRLPHIRELKPSLSFREKTFEITPLNFDVRFHQIVPRQSEDIEAPSHDIRQQSIEKCHQWLLRHTPR